MMLQIWTSLSSWIDFLVQQCSSLFQSCQIAELVAHMSSVLHFQTSVGQKTSVRLQYYCSREQLDLLHSLQTYVSWLLILNLEHLAHLNRYTQVQYHLHSTARPDLMLAQTQYLIVLEH